jgi:hypothetical protein
MGMSTQTVNLAGTTDALVVHEPVRRPGRQLRARSATIVAAAFVAGAAGGMALGWSAAGTTHTVQAVPAVTAATETRSRAAGPAALGVPSTGDGPDVVIPADRDIYPSSGIAVAGFAFPRPHNPAHRTVLVEVSVGGRLVASQDLAVYAGRFAGVIAVPAHAGMTEAQLRISYPDSSQPATVRSVTIEAPTAAPGSLPHVRRP